MGNFEKLSVLVIVVIIVMILVVALYTWSNNDETTVDTPEMAASQGYDGGFEDPIDPLPVTPAPGPSADVVQPFPAPSPDVIEPPVPAPAPPAPVVPPAEQGFVWHEVKEGETLGDIAKKHLGSVSKWPEIVRANPGLEPERLRPGQKVKVPTAGAGESLAVLPDEGRGASATPRESASIGGGSAIAGKEYTVRRGDTLEKISLRVYGTKTRWPEIWIENLHRLEDPSDIFEGMVLQIPAK
jgi:nucleoid-associated protein YgaU